jgi:hypothetical protein
VNGEKLQFLDGIAAHLPFSRTFAAKADLSSFGEIIILREEALNLPEIQRVLLACVNGTQNLRFQDY